MKPADIEALNYSLVSIFEEDDHSETEIFHEYSKLNRATVAGITERVGTIMRDPKLLQMLTRGWKTYRGHERIALPAPSLGEMTLEEAVRRRRSVSSEAGVFAEGAMTLEQLSSVLAFSYGVTRTLDVQTQGVKQPLRATTSAGGLYPLEIYPLAFDVDGLGEGIYHYRVIDHSLEILHPGPCREAFLSATTYRSLSENAAVGLAISAVFPRTLSKYLNRGYRFLMNDAGALLQSLYLAATALGLGACALGGYFDDEMGRFLGLDNVDEAVVICFLLGRKAPSSQRGAGPDLAKADG